MSAAVTAPAPLLIAELDGVRREALQAELLDVEDDLGHVLLDARDRRRELLVHVTDLDARDGRPLEGRQEDAAESVAEGDAVTGLERARLVLGERAGFFDRLDLRVPKFDHDWRVTSSRTRPRAAR